ncbi:alpha/beta fold hydrolase [uncultured Amphritea sp.]|uniref:alpha/beta fold hydrolase n=1 Tax=uncultured Amphritea sp. TaxID=981605 RepID=UPI0026112F49|nr:alpha/beta fold hydrolase [uncultured Amphritea sp.]
MPSCIINDREMHYLDQGEGFPLLLGHSILWDSRAWAPQLQLLSEHFRCIVPDLWSHGRSQSVDESGLSIEALAEEYHLLMQQLGIERYSVLGMSTGGLWGARLAMKYPDEVASLTLISCYLGIETPENHGDLLQLINMVEPMDEIPSEVLDAIVELFFTEETQALHPALVETLRFDLMFLSPEQIRGIVALCRILFQRQSVLDEIAAIRCPTLLVAGQHDRSHRRAQAEEMAQLMPESQFSVIENAGHMLTLEQPDQVNLLLARFLASIDEANVDVSKLVFI